jgi:hypothetical protein
VNSSSPGVGAGGRSIPEALVAAAGAGELDLALAPLISAWGRRPD